MNIYRSACTLCLAFLFACSAEESAPSTSGPGTAQQQPQAGGPAAGDPAADGSAAGGLSGAHGGTAQTQGEAQVVETVNSGGYTYALLDRDGRQEWFAVAECVLRAGDRVRVPAEALPQTNFKSPSLDRTFDVIYFASSLEPVAGAADTEAAARALIEQAHGQARSAHPADAGPISVARPEGGVTVAELWAKGAAGAGEEITLRGKVVKFNAGILGRNWLHVQDGSGTAGSNDITVTTTGAAEVGDTVLVRGKLSADRDFGYGYVYALLIEDAAVTVESSDR